uniref:Cationic amino acid transporter C-terminal domain-containing protein n=1 Tax=Arcella intermedia TaxID=1963864 RepID=A0A6B2L2C9_9EUKA
MRRTLRWWDLIMLGIGGIIGTGIFVLSGNAAAENAGPAIIISFILAGITALLAALSYSEMSSMIPVSGSAYTYAYATMGEFVAWIIGWDLVLEYMVGSATVAVGWSAYFVTFFKVAFGLHLDSRWTTPLLYWNETEKAFSTLPDGGFNLPGFLVVIICTIVLVFGIRESAWFNNAMVLLKCSVIIIFIISGFFYINKDNWTPFVPPNTDDNWRHFGVGGIFAAATKIFFAYIGFDAVTTTALECKNTKRDLPIGILGSLFISTVLYILVALVMTGVAHYTLLSGASPITTVAELTGQRWLVIILDLGALAGLTSVILINLLGQPRIFYSMAVDGLFPSAFAKVHPRWKTPWIPTIISGVLTALLGGFFPIDILGNLTSVGTLLAFLLVHIGIIILRFKKPDLPRPFQIPGPYYTWMVVPVLGILSCLALIIVSENQTIWRLFGWLLIGLVFYFLFGFWKSKLRVLQDDEKALEESSQPSSNEPDILDLRQDN